MAAVGRKIRDVGAGEDTGGGGRLGVAESMEKGTGLKVASAVEGVTEPERVREWGESAINVWPSRRLVYVAPAKTSLNTLFQGKTTSWQRFTPGAQ